MARQKAWRDKWPDPRLATFRVEDWPGESWPTPEAAARRRWREARLAALRRLSPRYRAEALVMLRESHDANQAYLERKAAEAGRDKEDREES